MKNTYTIIAKVIDTRRVGSSYYGNPRYLVTLRNDSGDLFKAYTKPNSMLAYAINNSDYTEEFSPWTIGTHYNKTCLEAVQ